MQEGRVTSALSCTFKIKDPCIFLLSILHSPLASILHELNINKRTCSCPKRRLSCARGSMLLVPLLIGGVPGASRYVDTYVRNVDSVFCMSGTAKV